MDSNGMIGKSNLFEIELIQIDLFQTNLFFLIYK